MAEFYYSVTGHEDGFYIVSLRGELQNRQHAETALDVVIPKGFQTGDILLIAFAPSHCNCGRVVSKTISLILKRR